MKLFKHPVTYFAIGAAALLIGVLMDVRPNEIEGKVIAAIIIACILAGVITGTGLAGRK